jgi:hypothetical protein
MNWGNYVVSVKKDLILYFLAPPGIPPVNPGFSQAEAPDRQSVRRLSQNVALMMDYYQ